MNASLVERGKLRQNVTAQRQVAIYMALIIPIFCIDG